MIGFTFKRILILAFLFLLKFSKSQDIKEYLQPKCDGKTIKYSIQANLMEYLKNENNIDNREIYYSLDDLKDKKIGIYSDTYSENSDIKITKRYKQGENFQEGLLRHEVDAVILFDGFSKTLQMISNELSIFPDPLLKVDLGFGLQKNNINLQKELNEFIDNNINLYQLLMKRWDLMYEETAYLDTNLDGKNGTLNIVAKNESSPYSYVRAADQFIIGSEVDFIYRFAKEYGYKINIKLAVTYEEQYESLKNKSADIALGFFVIKNSDEITFTNKLYSGEINLIVRYGNLPESLEWTSLYYSIDDYNGEKIGIQKGGLYTNLTKNLFPDSKLEYKDNAFELFGSLLMEEIEGFIHDLPVIEQYKNNYGWRISYYNFEDIEMSKNAFAFQKTKEGEALLKEFNDFLKTIDLKAIYNKWNSSQWIFEQNFEYIYIDQNMTVDTDLNPNDTLLNVAFNMDLKPLSYYRGNKPSGLEIDILYQFAKDRHYFINFTEVTIEDRVAYIRDGKANITGGDLTISEERKNYMLFSDPLYECKVALAVRVDSKKDELPITIEDAEFNVKPENIIDVNVKFGDTIKKSSCLFPSFFNDTFLINCTISDIKDVNVSNGFEFVSTDDKILILYNYIEANNFFQANKLIDGHPNIIQQGNTSNIVCQSSSSVLVTSLLIFGGILSLILLILWRLL